MNEIKRSIDSQAVDFRWRFSKGFHQTACFRFWGAFHETPLKLVNIDLYSFETGYFIKPFGGAFHKIHPKMKGPLKLVYIDL